TSFLTNFDKSTDLEDYTCEKSRCIRYSTASQKRDIYCGYKNGTKIEETKCDRKNRPKLRKECFNKNCMAEWRATEWSQCSKSCGPNGVQMRMLLCVWHGTRKPAGDTCKRGLQRGLQYALTFNNAACPAPGDVDDQRRSHLHTAFRDAAAVQNCQDHSKYCSVVKHMQKCRMAEYKHNQAIVVFLKGKGFSTDHEDFNECDHFTHNIKLIAKKCISAILGVDVDARRIWRRRNSFDKAEKRSAPDEYEMPVISIILPLFVISTDSNFSTGLTFKMTAPPPLG
uniref:Uncharacterized protein n=1 Tax=Romanomermis culicivorax TaxID=13658 RepID=A0A915IY87_ROMCU